MRFSTTNVTTLLAGRAGIVAATAHDSQPLSTVVIVHSSR